MKGEPNNAYGSEDCVLYYTDRQGWNDMNCYATFNYICGIPRGNIALYTYMIGISVLWFKAMYGTTVVP